MLLIGTLLVALAAAAVALLRPRRESGEEFLLTLPAGAPQARPGDRVRLRAVAEDGTALEGEFVVARATGAWVAVRLSR
jgi:hypothetical protein